jgi:SpoVK/Ycf46/Vps4 family AAA+-type ATPase
VLPVDAFAQLREICERVRHRARVFESWDFQRKLSLGKGLHALFAGPSGTGKTMAADIMARELGLELYKIDLSGVVSKYIGETEKNLARVFSEAESGSAILFFDEADALFGKRSEVKDAHDRYANVETSYLLQRMEEYEGISILATNLRRNMDEAFVRRIAFVVQFPAPEQPERLRIWQGVFPTAMPRGDDIDLPFMAERFKITGGNIKNIAVAAAFLGASDGGTVAMRHIVRATKRELQKAGKTIAPNEFGAYTAMLDG